MRTKFAVGMQVDWIFTESGPVGRATITSIDTDTKTITLDSIPPEGAMGDRIVLVEKRG